jgi:hypothetical protein
MDTGDDVNNGLSCGGGVVLEMECVVKRILK